MFLSTTEEFITVVSLTPYSTYLCSVAAQTVIGLGPYASPLAVTTDQDGINKLYFSIVIGFPVLFLSHTVPVGAPSSLVIGSTTSTSITLSWSPPPEDQQNGMIRHYVVITEETDSRRNTTLTSIHLQIVLGDLHPFYTYKFAVCAVTTDIGPCAYYDPVQLPQDGNYYTVY